MILFFGRLRDVAGVDRMECPLDQETFGLSDLMAAIEIRDAALGEALKAPTVRVAINKAMIAPGADAALKPSDEIAFMPPLSGG